MVHDPPPYSAPMYPTEGHDGAHGLRRILGLREERKGEKRCEEKLLHARRLPRARTDSEIELTVNTNKLQFFDLETGFAIRESAVAD